MHIDADLFYPIPKTLLTILTHFSLFLFLLLPFFPFALLLLSLYLCYRLLPPLIRMPQIPLRINAIPKFLLQHLRLGEPTFRFPIPELHSPNLYIAIFLALAGREICLRNLDISFTDLICIYSCCKQDKRH